MQQPFCSIYIPKKSNVLRIEDVITTGKSANECRELANDYGGKVIGFATIIDRTVEKKLIKEEIVSQIKFTIDTFDKNNLPNDLININAVKAGSRNLKNE